MIHYESVEVVPPGTRSVWLKYRLQSSAAGPDACSLYAVRMEANHQPPPSPSPIGWERAGVRAPRSGPQQPISNSLEITFTWSERQADYSLVERSHTEVVTRLPHRYFISVGGADHPVMNSLRIATRAEDEAVKTGYSDDRDVGGERFVPRWVTYGKNLAQGKPYTVTVPSTTQWGAGDPGGRRLTDGIAGPPYPGGTAPGFAACWNQGQNPEITVDLGRAERCGAFRIQVGAGWPWWDALKGEIEDQVNVLTSVDGASYENQGRFNFDFRLRNDSDFFPGASLDAAISSRTGGRGHRRAGSVGQWRCRFVGGVPGARPPAPRTLRWPRRTTWRSGGPTRG